jgi:carboxymethylenebutenolidase
MMGMQPERAISIINGLVAFTSKNELSKPTEIATIGWCMGGSWSFQASLLAGADVKACVMYYGFPEKDTEKLKGLKTEVLYIQALQDGFISKEDVSTFLGQLKASDKKVTLKQYEAVHAFAKPSNPKFDKIASSDAKKVSLEFIRKGLHLK